MAIVHVVARGSYQGHLAGLGCQAREQTVGGASGAAEHKRCLVCGGRNRRGPRGGAVLDFGKERCGSLQ